MSLWEKFTDWLMSDLYTKEERELLVEQTKALKLENESKLEKVWITVGAWDIPITVDNKDSRAYFDIQYNKNNHYERRIYIIGVIRGTEPIPEYSEGDWTNKHSKKLLSLAKTYRGYIDHIKPWIHNAGKLKSVGSSLKIYEKNLPIDWKPK